MVCGVLARHCWGASLKLIVKTAAVVVVAGAAAGGVATAPAMRAGEVR